MTGIVFHVHSFLSCCLLVPLPLMTGQDQLVTLKLAVLIGTHDNTWILNWSYIWNYKKESWAGDNTRSETAYWVPSDRSLNESYLVIHKMTWFIKTRLCLHIWHSNCRLCLIHPQKFPRNRSLSMIHASQWAMPSSVFVTLPVATNFIALP